MHWAFDISFHSQWKGMPAQKITYKTWTTDGTPKLNNDLHKGGLWDMMEHSADGYHKTWVLVVHRYDQGTMFLLSHGPVCMICQRPVTSWTKLWYGSGSGRKQTSPGSLWYDYYLKQVKILCLNSLPAEDNTIYLCEMLISHQDPK